MFLGKTRALSTLSIKLMYYYYCITYCVVYYVRH